MSEGLARSWDALHAANTIGWQVERPSRDDRTHLWRLYAFDPAERPKVGRRFASGPPLAPARSPACL